MTTSPRSTDKKRRSPLSVRFNTAERQLLEQLAGTQPLGEYIKKSALAGHRPSRKPSRTKADQVMLARVLAALGTSQLGASLERLSFAAKNGTLYVDDTLAAQFVAACDDIRAMHLHLLEALGKKLPRVEAPEQRLGVRFGQAAFDSRPRP